MVSLTICPVTNVRLLKEVPHRKIHGVKNYVLIYRNIDLLGQGRIVTHRDASSMGMSEDDLYKLACNDLKMLHDEGIGSVDALKALYEDAILGMAFVPEMLDEYLKKKNIDKVYVSFSSKGTLYDKIADAFNELLHGAEVLCYVKNRGFVALQEATA